MFQQEGQFFPQRRRIQIRFLPGRLFGGHFPLESGVCQNGGHLRVGSFEILSVFRAGIDLGYDIRTAGKDAGKFDRLCFQACRGCVEVLQPFLVADLCQGGVISAVIGERLHKYWDGRLVVQRLGVLDHLGGDVNTLLHFVKFAQVGDEFVTGAFLAGISSDIQADQMLVGIQGDGRVGKTHQITVFFVVEKCYFIALVQGVFT